MKVEGDLDSQGNPQFETGEFWYRDILDVHKMLLSNPDLADDSTYAPFHMYTDDTKKTRLYSEAMSGDWAWNTQVSTQTLSTAVYTD